MKNQKKIFLILIAAFALIFSTMAFGQAPSPSEVESTIDAGYISVEYHGPGWFRSEIERYKLEQSPQTTIGVVPNELKQDGDKYVLEFFPLNLDVANESWLGIRYLDHIYRIDASLPKNANGVPMQDSTNVEFNITRDGQNCNQFGKTIVKLDLLSDKYVTDFLAQCGIAFAANWETLAIAPFTTDVEIGPLYIKKSEIEKNLKIAVDDTIRNSRVQIIKTTNELNNNFRVLEINNLNHFQTDPNRVIFVHSETEFFTKSDETGKENGIVVTENGTILYLITLMDSTSNNFIVYKPPTQILATNYSNYHDLKKDAKLGWVQIPGQAASDLEAILATGAITTTAIATEVGTAYVIGQAPLISNLGGANFAAAVRNASFRAASFAGRRGLGVTGGIIARSGAMTLVTITPVGWVILGVAGATTTVYGIYHFTSTESVIYDNGKMIFNWDSESFSRLLFGPAAKANFIVIQNGTGAQLGTTGKVKISLPQFVQAIKTKFADVTAAPYKNLVENPIEGLRSGMQVYKADTSGDIVGAPLGVTVEAEGTDTLTISPLIEGQTYAFTIFFVDPFPTDHPPITAAFKVTKVE